MKKTTQRRTLNQLAALFLKSSIAISNKLKSTPTRMLAKLLRGLTMKMILNTTTKRAKI